MDHRSHITIIKKLSDSLIQSFPLNSFIIVIYGLFLIFNYFLPVLWTELFASSENDL